MGSKAQPLLHKYTGWPAVSYLYILYFTTALTWVLKIEISKTHHTYQVIFQKHSLSRLLQI